MKKEFENFIASIDFQSIVERCIENRGIILSREQKADIRNALKSELMQQAIICDILKINQ